MMLVNIWNIENQTFHLEKTHWKQNSIHVIFQPELICKICSKAYLSKAELASYIRFHDSKQSQVPSQQLTGNLCHFYDKECGSAAGLKSHMRRHRVNGNDKDRTFACHIWGRNCMGEFSLRSQMCVWRQSLWNWSDDLLCKESCRHYIYIYIYNLKC